MNEPLYFEEFGQRGSPQIVFLHGLLGSSRNWRSIGKALSERYHVYALDLPEHGNSPHAQETSLVKMAGQVGQWLVRNTSGKYTLAGTVSEAKWQCSMPATILRICRDW